MYTIVFEILIHKDLENNIHFITFTVFYGNECLSLVQIHMIEKGISENACYRQIKVNLVLQKSFGLLRFVVK